MMIGTINTNEIGTASKIELRITPMLSILMKKKKMEHRQKWNKRWALKYCECEIEETKKKLSLRQT